MELSDRLSRLEALVSQQERFARDLDVIHLQLTRAEGKLQDGKTDVRSELRIVEQRLERAERRLSRLLAGSAKSGD